MKPEFFEISHYFCTTPKDDEDFSSEFVNFKINDDGLKIYQEKTEVRSTKNNEKTIYDGFDLNISLDEAKKMRDFLNFALQDDVAK